MKASLLERGLILKNARLQEQLDAWRCENALLLRALLERDKEIKSLTSALHQFRNEMMELPESVLNQILKIQEARH